MSTRNALSGSCVSNRPAELNGWTTANHDQPPGSSTRAALAIAFVASSTSWSDMNAIRRFEARVGERRPRSVRAAHRDLGRATVRRFHHRRRRRPTTPVPKGSEVSPEPALAATEVERSVTCLGTMAELIAMELPVAVVIGSRAYAIHAVAEIPVEDAVAGTTVDRVVAGTQYASTNDLHRPPVDG